MLAFEVTLFLELSWVLFCFQAEDGIRYHCVTGVQTCALLFSSRRRHTRSLCDWSSDVCSSDLSRSVPLEDSLGALMRAREQGLTRHIGVSNFNIALLQQSIAAVGAANIATNQIELSPYLQNRAVTDFARQQGIHTTSYMTLGYGKLLADPVLADIASAHGATPA